MKISEVHINTLDPNEEPVFIDDEATEAKRITLVGKDFYEKPMKLTYTILPKKEKMKIIDEKRRLTAKKDDKDG